MPSLQTNLEDLVQARKVEAALRGDRWCQWGAHGGSHVVRVALHDTHVTMCQMCFCSYLDANLAAQ
jgi:hypothetical protein